MSGQEQNIDDYIAGLKNQLAANPQCANHHYNLGVAYLSKRMWQEAEKSFREAVDNSPRMAEAYVQLGGICLQRGDVDGCMNMNSMAKGCRPQFAVPFANLGFCYIQKGDFDTATVMLKKALNRDPEYIQAIATMGSAHVMKEEYDEGIKWSKKALKINAEFAPAWNNLAVAHLGKGDKEEAARCARKAQAYGFEVPEPVLEDLAEYMKED